MKSRSFILFLGLMILFISPTVLLAQEVIYKPDAPIPLDAAVIYGKLDNGLTYYVRENREPKERAEFYLVVNVGATSEDPDQNGLAHFTEHMAFNGTKNFDKKAIINYLQSIGMKFGPEINAFTSSDETNYMLQKVPTSDPKVVDTALLILYDWAFNIAFEDEEIDYERGVIHEEWRTGRSAMFRMSREANKTLLRNSKYADHDVIGDIDIIDNFEYDVIRRFYNDWYRPDLLAVVAVGDFNGREIEEKITGLFSREPKAANPRERKYAKVPDHEETLITIQTDKEAQYPIVQLVYKHDPMLDRNMNYYREGIKQQLFNSMLNTRLQELIISEDPPFVYGYAFYTNLVRTRDGFMAIAVANNNELDKALDGLLTENKRIRDHGFTGTELERAKNEFMRSLEKQYAEKDKMENTNFVWQYYSHFLRSEPAPGVEFDFAFSKSVVPGITLEEINEQAGKWIREENRVVVMMAPDNPDIIVPDEALIWDILKRVEETEVEAYVDKVIDKPLVSDEPAPAKVAKKGKNKDLGTTEWTFPNGVKVVMKTTDFKDDEILLSAFSFGGTSLYDIKDLTSASFAAGVVAESGLGEFDKVSLDKMLSGKIVNLRPVIGDTYEGLEGSCSVQDLETMLQMVYLYFTNPRIDDVAFNAFIKRMRAVLDNRALDPSSSLMDTVAVVMANYHPRVRPMTSEMLEEASLRRIRSIFRDRFGDPGGFTFYFVGNIDPEQARPLIEKYLGGLPTVTRQENWVDNGVRPPEGKVERNITREMKVPKGTVFISYSGIFDYDDYQSRLNLSSLIDILNVRYVETVREEEGGTYGVRVYESMSKYPYENYRVTISFDCDPQNADRLKDIIYREIAILQNEGPADKDLKGVVENKLKTYQENLRRNRYWLGVLRNRDFNQSDLSEYLKYENYVRNLSRESLKAAAQQFFGENIVEVVLIPENIEDNIANPVKK
ncbi:MAG: insulinase family protein [Bacteroidales bacterium]|nr:insulinase family protein [Bacteroidales bacterium]